MRKYSSTHQNPGAPRNQTSRTVPLKFAIPASLFTVIVLSELPPITGSLIATHDHVVLLAPSNDASSVEAITLDE